jgi:hypothetical protein
VSPPSEGEIIPRGFFFVVFSCCLLTYSRSFGVIISRRFAVSRENQLYEQAGLEISSQNVVPGIWAKAFSAALGDERATAALYIKFRVEEMEAEFQHQKQEESAKAAQEAFAKASREFGAGVKSFLLFLIMIGVCILGLILVAGVSIALKR